MRLKVDIIVVHRCPADPAAKKATKTIPIVMTRRSDPVEAGLIASLARPGGNVTGLQPCPELSGKQLELLKEAVPSFPASRFSTIRRPAVTRAERDSASCYPRIGVEGSALGRTNSEDFETVFAAINSSARKDSICGDGPMLPSENGCRALR